MKAIKSWVYFSLTNKGDAKSLKRYVTSNGLSFWMYNLFKPSIIDVTEDRGTWAHTKKYRERMDQARN